MNFASDQDANVENAAARYLLAQNGIVDAFTRTQFESGAVQGTHINTLMRRPWPTCCTSVRRPAPKAVLTETLR